MKSLKLGYLLTIASLVLVNLTFTEKAAAQTQQPLKCGDIVEGETIEADQTFLGEYDGKHYGDTYILDIPAGTMLNITVAPLGTTFNVGFAFLDTSGHPVLVTNKAKDGEPEALKNFQLGSSKQKLVIMGVKPGFNTDELDNYGFYGISRSSGLGMFFGAYRISIGCVTREGKIIEPGDTAQPSTPNKPVQTFTGVGFPGLPPVDFANIAKIPLLSGLAMAGAVTATGGEILGYVFDGKADSSVELTFTRLSGNLNLGLVVLSEDNKVMYQASLISSSTMITTFTLPSDGKYTVGVFRIDLLPPAAPEPTAFQVQIK